MQAILFIELLGGLGDVLMALPAIQALAASHPQAQMTVLTFAPGDTLLHHHPSVHRVLRAAQGQARQAVKQALREAYDLVVTDTTYDGIAELVQQSGAGQTVTDLWRCPPPDQRVSDRFLQILHQEALITAAAVQAQGQPRLHLTEAEHRRIQSQLGTMGHPRIGLYPEAGMAIKQWSRDRIIALGQLLQQHPGACLIVPASADPEYSQAIVDQLAGAIHWPRASLRELAALLAHLDCVVAADTGPARIAAAVGTPTITLFGPAWQGRYGQPAPHINLQGYPACAERNIANFTEQACWYSGTCPLAWDTCVNLLAPESVAAAVAVAAKLPELPQPGPPDPTPLTVPPQPRASPWQNVRNLLVLRLDNMGDVVMTAPALRAIKETRPDLRLTLLASPAGAQVAPVLPWLDEVLPWRTLWQALDQPPGLVSQEWELIETLKSHHFDGAIIFTSFKQSPHPPALVCQLAGIPLRLGASQETGECLTDRIADLAEDLHQVERNLRLVEAVGYRGRDRNLSLLVPPSTQVPLEPYLLLNPWTSCPARMYDLERFAIAARRLAMETGWPVVVTGTDKNRAAAQPLLHILAAHAIDRIGQTTLPDLVALVAQARLMLSNNTSTLHIADATQTPSVILFAGTELEQQWQPRQTRARLLRRPTTCSPCYRFTCPYALECLDIAPEAVVQAGLALLAEELALN
jgi:ADP-heptose:LPS heptosyltransferase